MVEGLPENQVAAIGRSVRLTNLGAALHPVPRPHEGAPPIKSAEDDPRMPAILEDFAAWSTWLGESGNDPVAAKALLKTMEGVTWSAAPEPKKPRAPRKR